jgi:hypothetical protein
VKIVCAEGTFLNDDNQCEKRRDKKPVATREKPEPRRAPSAAQAPYGQGGYGAQPPARQAGRYQGRDPSIGANGQPLTGLERQQGCNGYSAIMSGKCP